MFPELKRAIFKKSNLILIVIVFMILFFYAYHEGLKTSFNLDHATDISRDPDKIETILFLKKFYANFFRIVLDTYFPIQILAPVLLIVPYLLSSYNEKNNRFRYLMVSRKGNKKYIIHKALAIAISGTLVLAFAEILFGIFIYFITYHDATFEFLDGLVINEYVSFLYAKPYQFVIYQYLAHILYYFTFLIFIIGLTSFLKNKIAIIVSPFIISTILEMVLPLSLKPYVTMKMTEDAFTLNGYLIIISIYFIIGIIALIISEKVYLRKGF